MDLKYGVQVDFESFIANNKVVDLFICAYNHEGRAMSFFSSIKGSVVIEKAIALCYNKTPFKDIGDNLEAIVIENHSWIINFLEEYFESKRNKKSLNIVMDYSCMTKSWYYTFILYLKNKDLNFTDINTFFSYTPAKFISPKEPKPNKEIGPLPGKYRIPTDKPKALIVGLGFERSKAEGIIEHLEPKVFYLFYTEPASEEKFSEMIKKNNKYMLEKRKEVVFKYPYNDLLYLERQLTNLYEQLKDDYSIIIAPLGPKPFTFISIMLSVRFGNIDIWRVGSGSDINYYEYESLEEGNYIICNVLFTSHR